MDRSLFGSLRPPCVKISQLLGKARLPSTNNQELELTLRNLESILLEVDSLDDPLVDYVLFPILRIFQPRAEIKSTSVITAALTCLGQVLRTGRSRLKQSEFAVQILILLANLFEKQGNRVSERTASEPEITALSNCLKQLCDSGSLSYPSRTAPNSNPHVIIFGTLLAVIFEITSSDDVSGARLSSLQALKALTASEQDITLLRRYLPGLLSSLVKPFTNLRSARWSFRALVASLEIIRDVLIRCTTPEQGHTGGNKGDSEQTSAQWLHVNGKSLFSAFRHLVKAQDHDRQEVRIALFALCRDTLEMCHTHIDTAMTQLLISCAINLEATDLALSKDDGFLSILKRSEKLQQILRDTCHQSLNQLPNELQSRDPGRHITALTTATRTIGLAAKLEGASEELTRALSDNLLAVAAILMQQGTTPVGAPVETSLAVVDEHEHDHPDSDIGVVFGTGIQACDDVAALQAFIQVCQKTSLGVDVLKAISGSTALSLGAQSTSVPQLWLLATCLEVEKSTNGMGRDLEIQLESAMELGYNASLDILRSAPLDSASDWRAQVLAMNFIGQRAMQDQTAFQPELVYALYPIIERLACKNSILQRHAAKTLRIISKACGYESAGALLLNNADYLVNAVSIRLNTFDVRPEAATVLQVALKICGPSFLPYVGDLAESIFTILDMYHGYHLLVRSMFAVLGTIIDQAPPGDVVERMASGTRCSTLTESALMVKIRSFDTSEGIQGSCDVGADFPPGSDGETPSSASESGNLTKVSHGIQSTSLALIARVMRQAQFYLTYDAGDIRHALMQIVNQGFRALQHDENTLLPVINDLWPVLILRLYDSESYVAIETLAVLTTILKSAGDFLSSRIEDEWPRLRAFLLQHRLVARTSAQRQPSGDSLVRRQSTQVWKASMEFMETLLSAVRIGADMEDDILEIFGGEVQLTPGLTSSLETMNGDALWLTRQAARAT